MKILIVAIAIALTGCRSPQPARVYSGSVAEPTEVRYPDSVQAYHIGRHVDPSGALHEGHTVYRIETEARWNLHPGTTRLPPLPEAAAYSPPPLNDEIVAELHRQQDATERVMWEATQLAKSYDELEQVIINMTRVAKEHAFTASQVRFVERRLDQLEKQMEPLEPSPTD